MATGGVGLLCGVYLFLSYGIAQSRVRIALRCGGDPTIRAKTSHYSNTPQVSEYTYSTAFKGPSHQNIAKALPTNVC